MTSQPPGPRGHLLLGSARDIARDPLGAYSALAREHGDVVRIRFLLWPTYLLFHPDHVRHVLQERHTNYSKDLYTYRLLKPVVGNGLVTNDGASWLRQRRLIQPAFHRQRVNELGEQVSEACARMLERWEGPARRGEPVDVAAELLRLTLGIAGRAFFGVDLSGEADEAGRAFTTVNELLADYVHFPLPPLAVPSRRNRRLRAANRTLDGLVRGIIAERRREGVDREDVMSRLMAARDEETGQGMDDRQLRDEIVTMLFAGHDTTASTLTWACWLVSQHTEVERRLRSEATEAAGDAASTADGLPSLGYTEMVLQETMRLYPPGWSFGRKAIEDDEIGGYRIPAGSLVWVSPYVTHRHPDFWERPDEFDPERFKPERVAARPKFAYFPFASGPRMCIGRDFAMLVARLVLAGIARRYALRGLPGREPEPQALISLRTRHGMPMTLEPVQ